MGIFSDVNFVRARFYFTIMWIGPISIWVISRVNVISDQSTIDYFFGFDSWMILQLDVYILIYSDLMTHNLCYESIKTSGRQHI